MKQKPYNNSTKITSTIMKSLSERENTIITKANKGGGVVIMDVKDFLRELNDN